MHARGYHSQACSMSAALYYQLMNQQVYYITMREQGDNHNLQMKKSTVSNQKKDVYICTCALGPEGNQELVGWIINNN